MRLQYLAAVLAAGVMLPAAHAGATDLEVTHWWTSGGEAAAVKELAKAFDVAVTNGSTAPSPVPAARHARS